jgi:hypothetical protein
MKRFFLVLGMALLACSALTRAGEKTSPPPTIESTERIIHGATIANGNGDVIYVSPFCTLLGEADTRTENYGNSFELNWGWKAITKQQVLDYVENAITKVTFNGEEITDAEQGDVCAEDDV